MKGMATILRYAGAKFVFLLIVYCSFLGFHPITNSLTPRYAPNPAPGSPQGKAKEFKRSMSGEGSLQQDLSQSAKETRQDRRSKTPSAPARAAQSRILRGREEGAEGHGDDFKVCCGQMLPFVQALQNAG